MEPVPFTFDFKVAPAAKALTGSMAYALDDGDLLIEGTGLNFEIDRQEEAFEDNDLLQLSLDKFVADGGPLCYHHRHDVVLGQVLAAQVVPGKGVEIKARVDHQPESSPHRHLYEQIKKGTIHHLSGGGVFGRRMTPAGPRISSVDFVEWSATATPVGRGTSFAVVAGKALMQTTDAPVLPVIDYAPMGRSLDALLAVFSKKSEGKSVKGDHYDLAFLAAIMHLEQVTNTLLTSTDTGPNESTAADARVDALATRVKNYMDSVAREAHALAAELGPLPAVQMVVN